MKMLKSLQENFPVLNIERRDNKHYFATSPFKVTLNLRKALRSYTQPFWDVSFENGTGTSDCPEEALSRAIWNCSELHWHKYQDLKSRLANKMNTPENFPYRHLLPNIDQWTINSANTYDPTCLYFCYYKLRDIGLCFYKGRCTISLDDFEIGQEGDPEVIVPILIEQLQTYLSVKLDFK